jgi:hypothetical protein
VLVDLVQRQAQQGQANSGEDVVLDHVRLVTAFIAVAAVVELDAEHGHPVFIPADEEIDVLFVEFVPVTKTVGGRDDDVGQIDLGEELAATLAELVEKTEEAGLVFGEQGLGGVNVPEADLGAARRCDEDHAERG